MSENPSENASENAPEDSPKMKAKLCPIRSPQIQGRMRPCRKNRCELWNEKRHGCSYRVGRDIDNHVSEHIKVIASTIDRLIDRLGVDEANTHMEV